MRTLFYIFCSISIIGLAYWAYTENYKTQSALKEVAALKHDIAQEKEAIAVLQAEWAYLNRPERLRELVDLNFEKLGLIPLTPTHFGEGEAVPYPQDKIQDINDPVSVMAVDPFLKQDAEVSE